MNIFSEKRDSLSDASRQCVGMDIEWIKAGLEKPGKKKGGLAAALGIPASGVSDLLAGRRQLKASEIAKAEAYLEVSFFPSPLPRIQDSVLAYVNIIGEVAGGIWAEPNVRHEEEATSIPVDPRWKREALYLLRVRGPSINQKAREGDLVLCLDAHEAPRSAMPGDWVIMERDDAGKTETTVKKVVRGRDGDLWLQPDSDDPAFQTAFPIAGTEDQTIRVRAFVLRFVREATIF